jgi:hypothetical protein
MGFKVGEWMERVHDMVVGSITDESIPELSEKIVDGIGKCLGVTGKQDDGKSSVWPLVDCWLVSGGVVSKNEWE